MENEILDADLGHEARVYTLAGPGLRFANLIVDTIAYFAACFAGGLILGLLGLAFVLENELHANLFGLVIYLLYYVLTEGLLGRTLGKFATGTKVLTDNDQQPSMLNVLGRTLCRLIPFEAFSFLGSGYGWHDSISKTKVVLLKEKLRSK